jgi:hypothetical protein
MSSEDKLSEARLLAGEILTMPEVEVLKLFHRERKHRKLAKLVRHLDRLARGSGEDARIGKAALKRLGFSLHQG